MLATIDLHLIAKGLPDVAAGLLQHVSQVEPAFQMSATELPFFIGLVAGALQGLLVFELVLGKLGRIGRACVRHEGSIAGCDEYLNTERSYGVAVAWVARAFRTLRNAVSSAIDRCVSNVPYGMDDSLWSCHYERSEESAFVSAGTTTEETADPSRP